MIIAGGSKAGVEVLTGDLGTKRLPNLPRKIDESSMVVHNGTILLCGGRENRQTCLQLNRSTWKNHSVLNMARAGHSTVTTKTATFLFGGGGTFSRKTFEYLQNGSNTWLIGNTEIWL